MSDTAEGLAAAVRTQLREWGITLEVERSDQRAVNTDEGIDAIVALSRSDNRALYAVVAKSSMTLSALTASTLPSSQYPLLVIGNRINRRSAAALRDAGIQFIDALGNAFISFGNVLIEVQGRTTPDGPTSHVGDTSGQPHQPSNLFSTRRSQVILALLTWPELATARVRDIAASAGVSVGQAHDALSLLERAGFFIPSSGQLDRTEELLDYWTAAYPTGLGKRLEIAAYHGDPVKPVVVPDDKEQVFLSGESAGGTDIARPATLTFYVERLDPKLPIANRWRSDRDLPANIFVRQKFWTPPRATDDSAEIRNAPWPLVYADLMATKDARLREVAATWRASCST